MTRTSRPLPIVFLAALLLSLGCASSPEPAKDPMPTAKKDPVPVSRSEKGAEMTTAGPGPELTPIYFDTDQSLLRAEARTSLKRHAQAILRHPEWGVVTIEGHCDERGSEEYNLALGKRRAAAVAQYLMDMGVPAERMVTRTFGEEHPAVAGHDEKAWSKNRRSELRSEAYDAASR